MSDTQAGAKQTNFPACRLPAKPPVKTAQPWTTGICPNCGYTQADVDPDGILWCPACGYSKKGCYT